MHIVIVGCGRAGSALAARLDAEGTEVCAVDTCAAARQRLPGAFGGTFVAGNGMRKQVLEAAGIGHADALVALTESDSRNIVIARIAREVFRVPAVIGRLTDDVHGAVAAELGIDMVASVAMTVDRVHRALVHAPLDPEYVFGNGETLLVRAQVPGYLDGRRAAEFNVPGEIAVAEITRGGRSLIPGAAALLHDGDRVSFVVAAAALQRLRGFLGGRWEELCMSSSRVAVSWASEWPRRWTPRAASRSSSRPTRAARPSSPAMDCRW